jgi:hypothetical protein
LALLADDTDDFSQITTTRSGPAARRQRSYLPPAPVIAMASVLPKLTYFNVPARAFAARVYLFKAFGKDGCASPPPSPSPVTAWRGVVPTRQHAA